MNWGVELHISELLETRCVLRATVYYEFVYQTVYINIYIYIYIYIYI